MELNVRERQVLATVVENYIKSARPVGSRTVAKASGLSLSPASMRNVMADLTDKGMLEQPHTSAGRAPTAQAFRFYLTDVLAPGALGKAEQDRIRESLDTAGLELDSVLKESSRILSSFAMQVGMALSPGGVDVRWRSIDFVRVKQGLVMAILVLDGGVVQQRLVPASEEITKDDLVAFGNYLNHHYAGLTLTEARASILRELGNAKRQLTTLYSRALRLARDAMDDSGSRDLFFDGTANLAVQPEFGDVEAMRELLAMFDERSRLLELLEHTMEAGHTKVTFPGDEDETIGGDFSLVSSPYGGTTGPRGVVGVFGPMRMDYATVVPVVDFTAHVLTEILRKRS